MESPPDHGLQEVGEKAFQRRDPPALGLYDLLHQLSGIAVLVNDDYAPFIQGKSKFVVLFRQLPPVRHRKGACQRVIVDLRLGGVGMTLDLHFNAHLEFLPVLPPLFRRQDRHILAGAVHDLLKGRFLQGLFNSVKHFHSRSRKDKKT